MLKIRLTGGTNYITQHFTIALDAEILGGAHLHIFQLDTDRLNMSYSTPNQLDTMGLDNQPIGHSRITLRTDWTQ